MFAIASLVGTPLRLDAATQTLKRPSKARVQVEVDLLRLRPEKIWIGVENSDGFWQKLEYDSVPNYCCHCWHIGHSETMCHVHNPELKKDAAKSRMATNHVGTDRQQLKSTEPVEDVDPSSAPKGDVDTPAKPQDVNVPEPVVATVVDVLPPATVELPQTQPS